MPKKLTFEEVKEEFTKRGLKLLDSVYINNNQKMSFCNRLGYKAKMRLGNLKSNKTPCYFSKSNPYTIENIQTFLFNKKEGTIILSKSYKGNDNPLLFKCGSCKKDFTRTWSDLQKSKYSVCIECTHKKIGITRKKKIDAVFNLFKENKLKLLTTNYENNYQLLECEDENGYRSYMSVRNIARKGKIALFDVNNNYKYYLHNANNYAKINGIECEVLKFSERQDWTTTGIVCKCKCGNTFETSIGGFKSGKIRCEICSKKSSIYEYKVEEWLIKNKIEHVREKRFKNCKDLLPLPFDFYLEDKNILIEVDGEGHYKPIFYNEYSKQKAEELFNQTKKHDEIKTKYCEENEINLIRIPYWLFNDKEYEKILTNNIKV